MAAPDSLYHAPRAAFLRERRLLPSPLDRLELVLEALERALGVGELTLRVAQVLAECPERLAHLVQVTGEPGEIVLDLPRVRLDPEPAQAEDDHLQVGV